MQMYEYLEKYKVSFERLLSPPAFSASMRAKHLHVKGQHVAKSVLMRHEHGYYIVVVPASHQIDTGRLTDLLGHPIRLANASEVHSTISNCEYGIVPPFGKLFGVPVLLDESFDAEAVLVFSGSTHVEAFRLLCKDFEALEQPRRLPLSMKKLQLRKKKRRF